MKRKHIKLPTAGARGLLATLLIAGASFVNTSYNPHHYNIPDIEPSNQNKRLERIDWEYKLPDKDYKTNDLSTDDIITLTGRLAYAEARGSTIKDAVSAVYTAINRTKDSVEWNGEGSLREVILKSYNGYHQYSSFNSFDPNREKLMDPMKYDSIAWKRAMKVSYGIHNNIYHDPTNGATYYHAKKMGSYPKWAEKMIRNNDLEDTDHYYYKPLKEET